MTQTVMSQTVAPASRAFDDDATDVLVDGEAPESDEDEVIEAVPVQQRNVQPQTPDRQPDVLHRKLREKNQLLRRQLKAISLKPYASAVDAISSLNQQMLASGRMIEDVGLVSKKLSADIKCLTVCMAHLSEVGTTSAFIPSPAT